MSSMFSKPKKPKVIDPKKAEMEAEKQRGVMAAGLRRAANMENSVLTSGMGVGGPAPVNQKYLISA